MTNPTHDPNLTCWLDSANTQGSDFPIQNLPFGVFRRAGTNDQPRIGVAIGECILDLNASVEASLLDDLSHDTKDALCALALNDFMSLGAASWSAARQSISRLLASDNPTLRDDEAIRKRVLLSRSDAEMLLPATIGDYTDFYASIHHATNVGSMFRPDNPLMPNYTHLPVGYHGRASSIVASGASITRPKGQTKADDQELPVYGPCRLLDYELEMGFFNGPANDMGVPITMAEASGGIFGHRRLH